MDAKDRLIVALDVSDLAKAQDLARQLRDRVGCFKVGLEVLTSAGGPRVVQATQNVGAPIFYDGKFLDIPNTVAGASRAVTRLGVKMFNVHCLGGLEMMKAAREASEDEAKKVGIERPLVLGVTILTSLNYDNFRNEFGLVSWQEETRLMRDPEWSSGLLLDQEGRYIIGPKWMQERVVTLSERAKEAGLDGVIASPQEIKAIREACGPGFLIVTPGIRPAEASMDDQKRTGTPRGAIEAGADYIVVGRPITAAPDPVAAAQAIVAEIDSVR